MYARNRSNVRKPYDFYSTPIDCIENLLNNIDLSNYGNSVLEPSAGNGNICKIFKQYYPNKDLTAVELREEEFNSLCKLDIDDVIIDSFYNIRDKFDIIIGNPPYSEAQEFIEHSFELLNDNGILLFLLRTNFLESKKGMNFGKSTLYQDCIHFQKDQVLLVRVLTQLLILGLYGKNQQINKKLE